MIPKHEKSSKIIKFIVWQKNPSALCSVWKKSFQPKKICWVHIGVAYVCVVLITIASNCHPKPYEIFGIFTIFLKIFLLISAASTMWMFRFFSYFIFVVICWYFSLGVYLLAFVYLLKMLQSFANEFWVYCNVMMWQK